MFDLYYGLSALKRNKIIIFHILCRLKKAFVKEVLAEITENPPHYNT